MNSQFLIEKLESSEEFEKFMKENTKAYLCSGFFVIDSENKEKGNQYHFDFYVPETGKTFSFEMENEIKLIPLERYDEKIMEKVLMNEDFDFEKIEKMILTEMELKNIKNKLQKMIFSLQNIEKKDVLLGTIFVSGLGMIKADIDLKEKRITEFEKKSLFDMMKIVKK
jgi:hypothetical protein